MLDRKTILDLARLLNEVVVSGDRIGAAHHDRVADGDRVFGAYCRDIDFVPRAAVLRGALFETLLPDAQPDDDERIEGELAPRYWEWA